MPTVALAADGTEGGGVGVDLTEIVIAVVGLVFSAVIIPLTKAAFTWIKSKTENENIRMAIDEAQTVADNVTARLQVSIVDGLKEKSADGKLSKEDARSILDTAVDMVISDLSAGALRVIENNADDITDWLRNLIEARLFKRKNEAAYLLPEVITTE
jgi:uncharacterized membrane protein YhiD involved in acid resistance